MTQSQINKGVNYLNSKEFKAELKALENHAKDNTPNSLEASSTNICAEFQKVEKYVKLATNLFSAFFSKSPIPTSINAFVNVMDAYCSISPNDQTTT